MWLCSLPLKLLLMQLAVAIATFLPWIDVGGGFPSRNSFDVPVLFLLDKTKLLNGGVGLGVVLLVLAAAAFVLRHTKGLEKAAKIPGALVVPGVVMFLVQLNSSLSGSGGNGVKKLSLFDVAGIGVWPALIGAALLSWGGKRA